MLPRRSVAARIGRYQLLRHIATGGMADIFLAKSVGIADFEKLLVLKCILPRFASDARLVRMFLDEARVAATLHHANIVQVNEVGQDGDAYFFTMEFIHGADVRRILKVAGGQVPIEHVVAIAIEAAAGLHHAHERRGPDGLPLGLVHRDVSPSNLLVGFDGAVKLADFGIARASFAKQDTGSALMGKAPYMSPEQVLGQPLDRRSDIYSLGAVLHELVTGARLWQGEDERELMRRIVDQDAPPPSRRRPVPAELDAIALRALERDRGRRYPTAEAMRADLEAFARQAGLFLSRAELSRWMEDLFRAELEPWREAQRTGVTLESWATASIGAPIADDRTTEVERPVPQPRRRRAPLWIAAGGLLFAAAALIIALVSSRSSGSERPAGTAAGEPPAAADAAPVALEVEPAEAGPAAASPARSRAESSRPRRKRKPAPPQPPARSERLGDDSRLEVLPR